MRLSSETERRRGFVLIIDRRADRWMSVKSIMAYIEVNRECRSSSRW